MKGRINKGWEIKYYWKVICALYAFNEILNTFGEMCKMIKHNVWLSITVKKVQRRAVTKRGWNTFLDSIF